jgi:hypothetical protein
LETKWALVFLITFSLFGVPAAIFSMYYNQKVSGVLIGSIGLLMTMWSAYFITQQKKEKNYRQQ